MVAAALSTRGVLVDTGTTAGGTSETAAATSSIVFSISLFCTAGVVTGEGVAATAAPIDELDFVSFSGEISLTRSSAPMVLLLKPFSLSLSSAATRLPSNISLILFILGVGVSSLLLLSSVVGVEAVPPSANVVSSVLMGGIGDIIDETNAILSDVLVNDAAAAPTLGV